MYCSSCGAEVARGTSFCNLCGAKLNGAQGGDSTGLSPDSLVWAAVAVFIVGMGCTIGLIGVMKESAGLSNEAILAVTAASFLLMFVIEAVFIGLLLKRTRAAKPATGAAASESAETKELAAARPHALPEPAPLEPVPSVTEHTTRAFEPSYVERGAAKR